LRTRFIPNTLLPLFEHRSWPTDAATGTQRAASQSLRVDIAARMRGMWR
jgi:DNA helicase II / ATP-dependent DNA helicase PcrA